MPNKAKCERALKSMAQGLLDYAEAQDGRYANGLSSDYVLGEAWRDMAKSLIVLLGGERGRLDAGTVDRALRQAAVGQGWDEDFEEVDHQEDPLPPCAASMGCLCAGHASGLQSDEPCDTREIRHT